jgi:glycosyltransferase involved in cell wall biosynthesis
MSLKVSIVTPSYNQGAFIEKTIESVLSQDYNNIEYFVIDGGSTDETIDILKKYEGRLTWISEKDKGQSDAINKGFRMASGDIVAWLNSDDTYEPGAVSAIVPLFENNPSLGLLYGEGNIINERGEKTGRFTATTRFNLWKLIHVWDYILQPATFFRREALEKCGYLDESLHYVMDWDLWIRLALYSGRDVMYTDRYLANSREYGTTKTSTGGFKRVQEIREMMCRHSGDTYVEGFWLYYFDWITRLKLHGDEGITAKSIEFLNNLPIPDDADYCPPITNFNIRKNLSHQTLRLTYEDEDEFAVNVFVNDYLAERVEFKEAGHRELALPLSAFPTENPVHFIQLEYPHPEDGEKPRLKAVLT